MNKLLLLLLLPAALTAQIPDPQPRTYVNDLAHALTINQVAEINKQIHALELKYSVQLAVVVISEIPANYEIEDYAREIGRKWHVGNARNGLVYVAAINQRKQRLEVAANLEGIIPDITAKHITDNIKPFFINKDYAGGLLNMIKEIDDIINPEAQEQRKLAEAERQKKADNAFNMFLIIMGWVSGIAILVVVILWLVNRRKKKEQPQQPIYKPSTIPSRYGSNSNYIAPIIINNDSDYTPPSRSYSSDSYNGSSSSSSDSSSSSSSDYGNWGSGSSDTSSSSDSGYSGGGSSNDW